MKELMTRFTACEELGVASIVEVTDKTAASQKETPACFTPPLYLRATHTTPSSRSNSKRHGAMQRRDRFALPARSSRSDMI
jgi:hypothetical protein